MECYIPSDLIQSVSDDLPFLEDDNDTNLFDAEDPPNRYTWRAVLWGAVIIAVTIMLLVSALICHCCTCFCCCCGKRKERKKSTVAKWECALLNILMTLVCMGMIGAAIWADVEMNKNIVDSEDDVKDFLQAVDNDDDNADLLQDLLDGEEIRHGLVIAYLIVMFILLPLMVLTLATTPFCKLDVPVATVAMLVVFFIATFITALIFGGTFMYLILLGDICVGFYTLAGESDCVPSSMEYQEELETFCNDAFQDGFILFILGCGLLLGLTLLQCCGSTYSGLLTGKQRGKAGYKANLPLCENAMADYIGCLEKRVRLLPKRKEPPATATNEPSAWETYGTNQFLGVTSDVLVVAETVQLSPMPPPPSYAEIVEQDANRQREGTDGNEEEEGEGATTEPSEEQAEQVQQEQQQYTDSDMV